jgi:carbonic anhydrase/acetyltransferase-like protein (isoleucine patch superfamily)
LVERSILADGVTVGEGAIVVGVVAGSGASIGAGAVVPERTSIGPGGRYDGPYG